MGFLDKAKWRAVSAGRDADITEAASAAPGERREPQLDHASGQWAPTDPEIRQMAQAFEALYSPAQPPTDRDPIGRADNDNFFAGMPEESSHGAASGSTALLKREPADSDRQPSVVSHDELAPAAEASSASAKKTTIELLVEMRRAADEKAARTAMTQLRAAGQSTGRAAAPRVRQTEMTSRQRVPLHAQPVDPSPVEAGSAAVAAGWTRGLEKQHTGADASFTSTRPAAAQYGEASSGQRRVHVRMLAGAAVALIVGTGIGYMAAKSEESTIARAAVESTGSGMKLRLDRDLRRQ